MLVNSKGCTSTERTGVFITLLDSTGESVVSMDDMHIYEKMIVSMFEEKWSHIVSDEAVFLGYEYS